jgi:hypothetical protein
MEKFTLYFALANPNLGEFHSELYVADPNPKSSSRYKPYEISPAVSLGLSTPFGFRKAVHRVLPRLYHENPRRYPLGVPWEYKPVVEAVGRYHRFRRNPLPHVPIVRRGVRVCPQSVQIGLRAVQIDLWVV